MMKDHFLIFIHSRDNILFFLSFNNVVYFYDQLKKDYEEKGFNDNSEEILVKYTNAFNVFESEFEI